jgi:hypothetical protein
VQIEKSERFESFKLNNERNLRKNKRTFKIMSAF